MGGAAQTVEIRARPFTRLPDKFRRASRTAWADANRQGKEIDCFLEGPTFDPDGNLYVVDIPFGRIFRIDPQGEWTLVVQYDGWPNGAKWIDGRLLVADYRRGLVSIGLPDGHVSEVLSTHRSEGFKGLNDLTVGASGTVYFTDQGQTGLHDPTGRVFRLRKDGGADLLCDVIPSPNGIVAAADERALFVAVTRANAIWRIPLLPDGGVSKVGHFIQLSGGFFGPDGLAADGSGGLLVAHPGIGVWRFDTVGRATHLITAPSGQLVTNLAVHPKLRNKVFMTESEDGAILMAEFGESARRS
jgi:gluconolactonase